MAPTRRRRMPAAQRREVILVAAEATFARSGYHGASLDDIAHAAGVSKALIYEHFDSKRELHGSLLDAQAAEIFRRLEAAAARGETREERLRNGIDAFLRFVEERREAWRALFRDAADPEVAALITRVQAQATGVIARLIAADLDAPADLAPGASDRATRIEIHAQMLSGAVQSLATWWHDHQRDPARGARRPRDGVLLARRRAGRATRRSRPRPRRSWAPRSHRPRAPRRAAAPVGTPVTLRRGKASDPARRMPAGWWSSASTPASPTPASVSSRAAPGGSRRSTAASSRPARACPPERRLAVLHQRVRDLLATHEPDAVALEALYFGQNVATAFAVGQARGAILVAAGERGIPCSDYTPQQVKGAVCGSGRAPKDQVQRMVQTLLRLPEPPRPDHAADALAVGDLPRQPRSARPRGGAARGRAVIALVAGEVAVRRPDHVVIETAGGVGYRLAVSGETLRHVPAVGRQRLAPRPPRRPRRRPRALRLRDRGGARPLPHAARRPVGRPEGRARRPRRGHAAGPRPRARGRRRRPPAGRPGDRQAHGRADRRRAAREGGRPGRRPTRRSRSRAATTRGVIARDGLLELGFAPAEAQKLLEGAEGSTAEELLASALRAAHG